ncbi:unnamed protein product [Schistosoma margrebowiei]|uniref:Uncharacterized protein n=1 Tax=Schistosoma margrebowiei TaxID=48269 RepID=A0A183L8X5_9TREM|nr:unnamed protein product [Schistosoma margrebowiei]
MKTSTCEGKHGIQWTAWIWLDDLNFTDDLVLLSQTHQQIQIKTTSLTAAASVAASLAHTQWKIQYPKIQHGEHQPSPTWWKISERGGNLDSITDPQRRSDADVNAMIGKVRANFT